MMEFNKLLSQVGRDCSFSFSTTTTTTRIERLVTSGAAVVGSGVGQRERSIWNQDEDEEQDEDQDQDRVDGQEVDHLASSGLPLNDAARKDDREEVRLVRADWDRNRS